MILVTEYRVDRMLQTCTARFYVDGREVSGTTHFPVGSDGSVKPVDVRISLSLAFEWAMRNLTTEELEALYRLLTKK